MPKEAEDEAAAQSAENASLQFARREPALGMQVPERPQLAVLQHRARKETREQQDAESAEHARAHDLRPLPEVEGRHALHPHAHRSEEDYSGDIHVTLEAHHMQEASVRDEGTPARRREDTRVNIQTPTADGEKHAYGEEHAMGGAREGTLQQFSVSSAQQTTLSGVSGGEGTSATRLRSRHRSRRKSFEKPTPVVGPLDSVSAISLDEFWQAQQPQLQADLQLQLTEETGEKGTKIAE